MVRNVLKLRLGWTLLTAGLLLFFGFPSIAGDIARWLACDASLVSGINQEECIDAAAEGLVYFSRLFGVLCAMIGFRCVYAAKRHSTAHGGELLKQDSRPPVLYLRSFKIEGNESSAPLPWDQTFFWETEGVPSQKLVSWEERFAKVLSEFGPVIALGRPGEKFAPPGAARWYISDDQWQSEILKWLPRSALVVIRAGSTNALWWEIEQALQLVEPERLVILAPAEEYGYEKFRPRLEKIIKRFLPTEGMGKPLSIQLGLWWILSFGRDWTPRLTGTERGAVAGILSFLYGFEYQFKQALLPTFRSLHLKPAPMRWWRVGWVWLGILTPAVLVITFLMSPLTRNDASNTPKEFYDRFRKGCVDSAPDQIKAQAEQLETYCDCLVTQAKAKNLASTAAAIESSSEEGRQKLVEIMQPCVDKSEHQSVRFYDELRKNCVDSAPDEIKGQTKKINAYCDCVVTQAKAKSFASTIPAVGPSSQQGQSMLDEVQQKWDEIMKPCTAQLQ